MAQIPVVFGEWVMRNGSWHFDIDGRKGGRMFILRKCCTYSELVEMAEDDYVIDKKTERVKLSYPLSNTMLQQMPQGTPPMYVTNDRAVQNLIEFSTRNIVRLCVSSRSIDGKPDEERDIDSNHSVEDGEPLDECDIDVNPHSVEDGDPCDEECAEDFDGTYVHENNKAEEVDEMDFDYSEYGQVKDEDEDGDVDDMYVHAEEAKPFSGAINVNLNNPWVDQLWVGQCFPCKDALISEIRLTAVMLKFSWRVVACVKNEPKNFWVTKYVNFHTCSMPDRVAHRRRCTPKYIGRLFIDRVGIIDGVVPQHIEDSMRTMFGMTMDYTTSYRALVYAQEYVRGSFEAGYAKLPYLLRKIEQSNPGSVIDLVVDDDHRFKYLFISLEASIRGFNDLRRVIVVDGTHLTGKYEGVMLLAAAQDGNFQIFPLAFAIVDSECDASWEWFFTKLSLCFSDEYALVVVSDMHGSIAKACATVIPWATRGICYYHLQQNIVAHFNGKQLMYIVKGAAYAHTVDDFDKYMDALMIANPALVAYLEEAEPSFMVSSLLPRR